MFFSLPPRPLSPPDRAEEHEGEWDFCPRCEWCGQWACRCAEIDAEIDDALLLDEALP